MAANPCSIDEASAVSGPPDGGGPRLSLGGGPRGGGRLSLGGG
jgi:hypothetical protein